MINKKDLFKKTLFEKIDKCISDDDLEKLSEKEIVELVNDTKFKRFDTFFKNLPKDVVEEIVDKCKPIITVNNLKMPKNPSHPVYFDLYVENRFGPHLLWDVFYKNTKIEFTKKMKS